MTREEFARQLEELLSSPMSGQPLEPNKTGLWIEWAATCAHNTLELQRRISHDPKEYPSLTRHYYEQAIMDRLYAVFQRIRNIYGREAAQSLYFQEQPAGLFYFEMMGAATHLPLELWELLYPRLKENTEQSDNGGRV